jgi:hypothetical protein
MRGTVLFVTLAIVAGCKKSPSRDDRRIDSIAKHRAEVEKVLDAFVAIGNKPLGPVAGSFTFKGPGKMSNAMWLPADPQAIADFRAAKEVKRNWFDGGGSVATVPQMLAGKSEDPDLVENMLTAYAETKLVLLIKTREYKEPVINDNNFTAGHVVADLYLFGIDGTPYGSVRIEATNSDNVTYEKRGFDRSNAKSMVESDLEVNANTALKKAVGIGS